MAADTITITILDRFGNTVAEGVRAMPWRQPHPEHGQELFIRCSARNRTGNYTHPSYVTIWASEEELAAGEVTVKGNPYAVVRNRPAALSSWDPADSTCDCCERPAAQAEQEQDAPAAEAEVQEQADGAAAPTVDAPAITPAEAKQELARRAHNRAAKKDASLTRMEATSDVLFHATTAELKAAA